MKYGKKAGWARADRSGSRCDVEGDGRDVSDVESPCAEHQMLLKTDYRPDFDDALQRVDKVWYEPLLLRE